MSISVLRKFSPRHFYKDPFPHIFIENCIEENIYRELEDSLDIEKIKKLGMRNDSDPEHRYKLSKFKNDNYALNYLWREFLEYHSSDEFVKRVLNIFDTYVENISLSQYAKESVYLRSHIPSSVSRKELRKTTVSDCQIVIHDPLVSTKTTRTIHIDSPKEIYAGLLYMKQDSDTSSGGSLELYSNKIGGTSYIENSLREVCPLSVIKRKVIDYKKNSFVMFLNAADAVHGVSPRVGADTERISVNMIAERAKSKFFIP